VITVSCPKCNKVYSFDESQIPLDLEVLQCKLCGTYFFFALDGESSALEDYLFPDPVQEELDRKEEALTPSLNCYTDQPVLQHEKDEQIVELTEQMLIEEETAVSQPASGDGIPPPRSKQSKKNLQEKAAGTVQFVEEYKIAPAGFSAERYRYLNVKRRNSRRKVLLYCAIALLSLFLICYYFLK